MTDMEIANEPQFKIRDGLGVMGVLIAGALILTLTLSKGNISLGPGQGLLITATGQLLSIIVITWLAQLRGLRIGDLFKSSNSWWYEAAIGIVGAVALWAVATVLWRVGLIPISDRLSVTIQQTSLPYRLAFFGLAVFLAPFAEELLYRGVIQGSILSRFSIFPACLVQASLFALMHQKSLIVMLSIFVGGLAYGLMAYWRRSLFASTVMHASFNCVGAGWLVLLFWINAHDPAKSMSEAESPPHWMSTETMSAMPEGLSSAEAFDLVVRRFGSGGLQMWKSELRGLEEVRRRFPQDGHHGALSLIATQEIYLFYLNDPWRAIFAGKEVVASYPQKRELCARATEFNARAYLLLGDEDQTRRWLRKAEVEYAEIPGIHERLQSIRSELDG